MRRSWMTGLCVMALTVLLSGTSACADALEDGARAFIQGLSGRAITELTDGDISQDEREHRFRVLLKDHFDVPTIGKWVLGRYWRKATPEQRTDYLNLFEDLIVVTYLNRFDQYAGENLSIAKVTGSDGKSVTVYSKIVSTDQSKAVGIDWRIAIDDGVFRIVDVVVEGVSMSQTQRSEFGSVIRQNGGKISGLLDELRRKTQKDA